MVAQLVQAKLADDIIAQKIDECEVPQFLLDPGNLMALKRAGVSDALIRVMAGKQNGARPAHHLAAPRTQVSGDSSALPDEVGVYWAPKSSPLQRIEGIAVSNDRTGSMLASNLTLGIKRARVNAQLKNARADLRITDHQPSFYFYLSEGASIGDYLLLKLAQRKDVRQIEVAQRTFWKTQRGVDHLKEFDFSYQRVKSRLYLLTPKTELPAGEYGFYIAAGTVNNKPVDRIYDFGVD